MKEKRIPGVIHGVVYSAPEGNPFCYFGWPTVCRTEDGTIWAGASGFRTTHVDPYGKSVLFRSTNDGRSWSEPEIINDSMIDDRDAGLLALPGNRLLLSWFTSDTRFYAAQVPEKFTRCRNVLDSWEDDMVQRELGSLIRIREADGSWGGKQFVVPSAPHGPIRLRDGRLFYLGSRFGVEKEGKITASMKEMDREENLVCCTSTDEGKSWLYTGAMALPPAGHMFCEPHAVELKDGRILAHIRVHNHGMFVWQSISSDGGASWSKPEYVTDGGPPHLMRTSEGILVSTYGYRKPGYGQRVMFSTDEGKTWDTNWILRDDAFNADLGYPSTVECANGDMLTVYYQWREEKSKAASLLWTRWKMPEL